MQRDMLWRIDILPVVLPLHRMFNTLISVDELARNLNAPHWLVIDCRFNLADASAGYNAYLTGHLAGACYAHLDRDLSAPISASSGRHPLPAPEKLIETFSRFGIEHTTQVIAYDADNGMFAARLWWLLRWMGHTSVAVLDGGIKAWQNAGHALTRDAQTPAAKKFIGAAQMEWIATPDEVAQRIKQTDWRVLDARTPERFRGDVEPIDAVAGHIPGARNHPFAWNLDANGSWLSKAALAEKFRHSLAGVPVDRSIVMCGSGVTACHNLLAMEVAQLDDKDHGAKSVAQLYAGSWSEWIRDPKRAVERG
jgi:thiosulfate/3-mercaptopyruvate sulfurtransferase